VKLLERLRELTAIQALLDNPGEILLIEGGIGLGKTALVEAGCRRAAELDHEVLHARGSELEVEFAFGVVRQLFERRIARAEDRDALLAGPAVAVRPLLVGGSVDSLASDRSFAVLHGLYWLAANLAAARPLLLVVDDAHWTDEPSLRWLAYLATRLEGLAISMLVALRPTETAGTVASLLALRTKASAVVHPSVLSEAAVGEIVDAMVGHKTGERLRGAVWVASGGNPLYVTELLRGVETEERWRSDADPSTLLVGGRDAIARRVVARVRELHPSALDFAQAVAILGDECELRHAAAIAGVQMTVARRLAAGLARLEVLETDRPPRFIHPVVRDALEASLSSHNRDGAHLGAARLLHSEGALAGRIGAHLVGVAPAADLWVLQRLREAAQAALANGAPQTAATLLARALAEPPPPTERVEVLRETARAEVGAGIETATTRLEEALKCPADPRERAEIALEAAEAYAALFRWTDAVDVIERVLTELAEVDDSLASRLEGELVVCGLHDARRASRVAPVLKRLASRSVAGSAAEALGVARGMAMLLVGRPVDEAALPLEQALARAGTRPENWDTRAALLWSLITTERFEAVASALDPMVAEAHRSGSARGLVASYSTLGFLNLRLGMLPEADAAARVALRVLQEGDFAPGLPFAATVLADVSVEAGELDEAQALIAMLAQEGWPPGVGTVLIPAARGRLRLAQGRPAEALADFQVCAAMFGSDIWGMEMRDVGYLHARSGAAQAMIRLGNRDRAHELAKAELSDVTLFGAPRALGIALRTVGLTDRSGAGIEFLTESVAVLRRSPALLERAHSLAELGAALRRNGQRAAAREPLLEALDLAARCGARPLSARARDELKATGARPRRAWRTGIEALTPSEQRIVRLAVDGRSNRDIAHELFVTVKTVEGHLSRVYSKLGIEGRAQLARVVDAAKTRVPTL
jgi:DNA-binding CsgD family transcriptional regulator/tetratricopeptide (TPR) repeat protein